MCNYSEFLIEQGMEKGMEKGIEKGRAEGREERLKEIIRKMKEAGYPPEEIDRITGA